MLFMMKAVNLNDWTWLVQILANTVCLFARKIPQPNVVLTNEMGTQYPTAHHIRSCLCKDHSEL